MKKIFSLLMACAFAANLFAQETLDLEYVMTLQVSLGQAYSVGTTVHGDRNVVPITGGTFEGPNIKGTIIPGGADWQLTDKAAGRTDVEAIYSLTTDDGVNIHIRNYGIIANGKDAEGKPSFYFRCAPKFEAPIDSKYAWLNNAIYVCAPIFGAPGGGITLKVWKVK
ncbi:MAG: DUF3237 domain-containing protein [Bacteroidaceae bacterium]|nr:DUF3237 domain-containing protein [Bacteroidaceae bacterium]